MGHAILTELIGLVDKTVKMIYFSRKRKFLPFKLGFGSMTPKRRTLMAALLKGGDAKMRPPETLKCSTTKMFKAGKLKPHQPIYLIR